MIICALLVFPAIGNAQDTPKETMVVSGHPDYPPFMWSEGSEMKGVSFKLLKFICGELNIKYKIVHGGPWERVQRAAQRGEIDTIVGIYSNAQRRTYLHYTDAYAIDPTCIATRSDSAFTYTKPSDLIGKVGISMRGDSFGSELDNYISKNLKLERANTAEAVIKNLINSRVDYILWGKYPILWNSAEMNLPGVKIAAKPVIIADMHMAFSKRSPFKKYATQCNAIIKKLRANGTIEKWIRESLLAHTAK